MVNYVREHYPNLYEKQIPKDKDEPELIYLTRLLYGRKKAQKQEDGLKLLLMFARENNIPIPTKK